MHMLHTHLNINMPDEVYNLLSSKSKHYQEKCTQSIKRQSTQFRKKAPLSVVLLYIKS